MPSWSGHFGNFLDIFQECNIWLGRVDSRWSRWVILDVCYVQVKHWKWRPCRLSQGTCFIGCSNAVKVSMKVVGKLGIFANCNGRVCLIWQPSHRAKLNNKLTCFLLFLSLVPFPMICLFLFVLKIWGLSDVGLPFYFQSVPFKSETYCLNGFTSWFRIISWAHCFGNYCIRFPTKNNTMSFILYHDYL